MQQFCERVIIHLSSQTSIFVILVTRIRSKVRSKKDKIYVFAIAANGLLMVELHNFYPSSLTRWTNVELLNAHNIFKHKPDNCTGAGKYATRTSLRTKDGDQLGWTATALVWTLTPSLKRRTEPRTMVKRHAWLIPSDQQWAALRTRLAEMRDPPHTPLKAVSPIKISAIIPACKKKTCIDFIFRYYVHHIFFYLHLKTNVDHRPWPFCRYSQYSLSASEWYPSSSKRIALLCFHKRRKR